MRWTTLQNDAMGEEKRDDIHPHAAQRRELGQIYSFREAQTATSHHKLGWRVLLEAECIFTELY